MDTCLNPQDYPDAPPESFLHHFAAPEGKRTVLLSTVHISDYHLVLGIYSDVIPLLPCSSNLRSVFIADKVFFFLDYSSVDRDAIFYAPEILSMINERIFRDYLFLKRNTL